MLEQSAEQIKRAVGGGNKKLGRTEVTAQEQPAQESYNLPDFHPRKQAGWNKLQRA